MPDAFPVPLGGVVGVAVGRAVGTDVVTGAGGVGLAGLGVSLCDAALGLAVEACDFFS